MADWLEDRRRENAQRLAAQFPMVESGMFVQVKTWFGDVWAEVISVYASHDEPVWNSVTFYRYEKYGVTRKRSTAYYGDIRKFCRQEEIDFPNSIVHAATLHSSYGRTVEWPVNTSFKRDTGGYEMHPTKSRA